ncbi:MAG: flagellin [Anaerovibrio sp.]|nr:flagellin [Anaerovibrio sp.]
MAMVVKNNMTAINTLNTLNKNSSALSKSLQKVSSGMKINSAADDASGYAISERMRVQIRSLDQANQNTQNGSSMMKVAEGAVSSTVEILKTLKEKAVNAANDSNTDSDRQTIQKELDQSIDQINDNANVTFNGKYLVDGSKNTVGNATYTALSNQNLSTDTTEATKLTELKSRSGDSLEIMDTDKVTVSYVKGGKTYSATFDVSYATDPTNNPSKKDGIRTLQDIFTQAEMINDEDTIFGSAANDSIAKVNGLTDAEKTAKQTEVQTANNAFTSAKGTYTGAVTAFGTAQEAFDTAVGAFKTAIATYNAAATDKKIDTNALAGLSGMDYLATAAGLANFDELAKDTTNGGKDAVKAMNDALTAYNGAAYAQGKTLADIDVRTGGAVKTYDDAVAAYEAAKINYSKSAAAPSLLTGSKVGVSAADSVVETASGQNAVTITANASGVGGQISGFNISISDKNGNVKKSANAALDAFEETVRAQNKSEDNAISLQVGAKANQSIKVGLTDMRAEALGLQGADGTKLNISTQNKANAAINVLDNAIQKALDQQTTIGSVESRLEYTSTNLTTASENVQSSESTIRDADMAKEMTNYTKNNVLLQAAQSMLAQANQSSSNVLSLLQ